MEVNKEEALRCLHIAHRHRTSSNLPSALKFAKKSVSLYSTPEGVAMVTVLEREISTGGGPSTSSSSSSTPETNASTAKASGVEEHVTNAKARPAASHAPKKEKREYTAKQVEVVKRVKGYQHHQYYEILSVERTCTENDVKKAYKKLALALHPDKNGAPGADEAFKMVSKAFQVLSDADLRAAFDSNPNVDPTQRNAGMSRGGGGGGGGMQGFNGGFQGDINPEDLFNMFFGGGGGGFGQANVFTFGGPGGFQAQYARPRRRAAAGTEEQTSPLVALLPLLVLFLFAFISIVPTFFSETPIPEPAFSWSPSETYDLDRHTYARGVEYWVNTNDWNESPLWKTVPEERRARKDAALYSPKVKAFERNVENYYIRHLQNECEDFNALKQQRISSEAGIFGIGADYDKIRAIRAEKSPACEQLKNWGLMRTQTQKLW
ncbi:hypothetical protein BCR39DRAFT_532765 [Naematelia encephala]|uniref:J domain-containing protein n=1 Tax=Naematelia encephala TaxID=71784 RepID=A0A1Y2B328_9TREE|nr:hypothetical protein BCR39DRAFT_532765 [Naematelia encephala]